MHQVISAQDGWETDLAPRILLGLWHPTFVEPAHRHVPYLKRSHIGLSPHIARKFFWVHVKPPVLNSSLTGI
jgi:phosphatidylglycerol phospholipase C